MAHTAANDVKVSVAESADQALDRLSPKMSLGEQIGLAIILAVLVIATAPWMFGANTTGKLKPARRF